MFKKALIILLIFASKPASAQINFALRDSFGSATIAESSVTLDQSCVEYCAKVSVFGWSARSLSATLSTQPG